jgi:ATP-binding cassette subfamily C protein EexD
LQSKNLSKPEESLNDLELALKKVRSSFYTIGIYSFFINILMLAAPLYMLVVYDIVMPAKSLDTLFVVTLVIILFFVGGAVLEYVRSRVMVHVSNKLDASLNQRVFNATFDLAAKYPNKANSEPLRDFNTIKTFLTGQAAFSFFDAPWFPIYLAIMFAFDPVYGFYGLGATAITITHDMSSVRAIADHVAMIHAGKVRWHGPVAHIDNSGDPYVDQFINGRAEGPIESVR